MSVRPDDQAAVDHEHVAVVGAPDEAAVADSPSEQREEIEETRGELSETLDEIGQRLDPAYVADEAKQKVREATIGRVEDAVESVEETAKGAGSSMLETIRHNPIPTAMAAIGLGMLWMNRSDGQESQRRYRSNGRFSDYRYDYGYGYRVGTDERRQRSGQTPMDQARNVAGQAVGSVEQAAGDVGDRAGQFADQVGETAGELMDQGGMRLQQAGTQFQQLLDGNPLAMGAAAIAAGAVMGMVLPETRQERQVMGEASRTVTDEVQQTASTMLDKGEKVAQSAAESAQTTARQEGLTE
jgi:hypothetical protein